MNKKSLIFASIIAIVLLALTLVASQKSKVKLSENVVPAPVVTEVQPTTTATNTIESDLTAIDATNFDEDITSINADIGGL
jgi:hypothetical protein